MTVRKVMLATSTYVFPLVAMPLLAAAWLGIARSDWRFVTLVLGVPIIFGYVTVIVAARIVKRWSMTGRWHIGGAYVHHDRRLAGCGGAAGNVCSSLRGGPGVTVRHSIDRALILDPVARQSVRGFVR